MYAYKDLYTIDFRNVEHYFEAHFAIRDALDFPHYYGCNLDALWDCLTDMVGRPIHIELIGIEVIEAKFDDFADRLIEILREFKHYGNDKYANEIHIEVVRGSQRVYIH